MKERQSEALYAFLMLALVLIIFGLAFCASGCRSTGALPTPETPLDVVEKEVPVPCIVVIELLPPLQLPPRAAYPAEGDDEAKKVWALAVGEAVEAGDALCKAQDTAWREKVQAHNSGMPLCSDVVPPVP